MSKLNEVRESQGNMIRSRTEQEMADWGGKNGLSKQRIKKAKAERKRKKKHSRR